MGPWVELFRRAPGYLGTHLLRERSKSTRYDRHWRDYAGTETDLRALQ